MRFFANEKFNGGGRGIRTPARFDPPVGFQDRSLQPDLGIPPYSTKINITFTITDVNKKFWTKFIRPEFPF